MDTLGQGSIHIEGKVRDQSDKSDLENCTIYLVTDNYKVEIISTDENGDYSLILLLNKYYKLFFTHQGYVQKHIFLDTYNFSAREKKYEHNLHIDIILPKISEGIDWTILDDPIGIFSYHSKTHLFTFDKDYTKKQQIKIADMSKSINENDDVKLDSIKPEKTFEEFSILGNIECLDSASFEDKAYILVYKNDTIFRIFNSNSKGDYSLTLPYQSAYQLYYCSVGYVSKNIIIDLRFPSDSTPINTSINLNTTLYRRQVEIDYSLYDQPFRVYQYRRLSKEFDFNKTQSKAIHKLDSIFLLNLGK